MDDLDRKILALLAKNARMPVKEIAEQVAPVSYTHLTLPTNREV